MHVSLMQQLATDGFACPALKEHVVRYNDCCAAVLFQHGVHVLYEIKLLVARGCPEVLAVYGQAFFLRLAIAIYYGDAALFPKGRIGEHHVIKNAAMARQRVPHLNGHIIRGLLADAMEHQVHAAEPRNAVHQFRSIDGAALKPTLLLLVELVVSCYIIVGSEKKTAGSAGRVA